MDAPETLPQPRRLGSIDAYRGFVMFLMMAEVLRLRDVAKAKPGVAFWAFLSEHQTHVEWIGCTLHDLIQPSFSLLVGVALPFSIAARLSRGQSTARMTAHALWRALILVALGVFLRSVGKKQTYYTFEDTLSQIGLGYPFLFLLGLRPKRDQWIALFVILVGYWAAFALYPLPSADFDYAAVGVPASWPHRLSGFAAHWDKNSNAAWAFDRWFLNLFPRERPFTHNGGGYATLSFIPTLGTMLMGLLAGGLLSRDEGPKKKAGVDELVGGLSRRYLPAPTKLAWLVVAGLASLAAGLALGHFGINPVVKRIWTPSWVLFSGGWCLLILSGFYAIIDGLGLRGWAYPLVVIGRNPIAAYVMAHLFEGFFSASFKTHLGRDAFRILGADYEPLLHGAAILLVLWLILFWMDRRRLYLRV